MHADHLPLNSRLQRSLHVLERLPADADRPQLGKAHAAVAADQELKIIIPVPVQLHVELIVGADDVVGRHRDVRGWRKRRDHTVEQLVAERLQRSGSDLVQRQLRHAYVEVPQRRLNSQAQSSELLGQSREWNRRESREREHAVA